MSKSSDRITALNLRLMNILVRVVGVVFVFTGIGLLIGSVLTAELQFIEFVAAIFSLIVGVLFVRVKKATLAGGGEKTQGQQQKTRTNVDQSR